MICPLCNSTDVELKEGIYKCLRHGTMWFEMTDKEHSEMLYAIQKTLEEKAKVKERPFEFELENIG